jgi:hypothetical protein
MSMTLLAQAERQLLQPGGFSSRDLDRVFAQLMGPSIDAADLYFQHSRSESWMLEDGIVREGSHAIEQGVGVRAMSGEKTGFAYSDEIVLPQLLTAAQSARAIAQSGNSGAGHALAARESKSLYAPIDPVESLANEEKIALLREVDKFARSLDPCITQVIVTLSATLDTVLVAAADGTLAADVRPLVRLNVNVIAERNGRRESGTAGGGGRYGYRELLANGRAHAFAREAVRTALVNLDSVPAPAGRARRAASRGHRPRIRGRFQPQGNVGLRRTHGRKNRVRSLHRRRRRHAAEPAWFAVHRRRRRAGRMHGIGRERRAQGLHAGQAQCAPHGHAFHRQRPPRILRAPADAAHDQHLHAAGPKRPG